MVARGRDGHARGRCNARGEVLLPGRSARRCAGSAAGDAPPPAEDAPRRSPWSSRSRPGWSPRRSAAAARPCSPRCARSSPRSPGRRPAPGPVRGVRLRPGVPVRAGRGCAATRPADQRDLVLHLPDELYVLDRKRETAIRYRYEFDGRRRVSTAGLPRQTRPRRRPGHVARSVRDNAAPPSPSRAAYARGRASRPGSGSPAATCSRSCPATSSTRRCASPAAFYERLRQRNPAPYEFFFNLGEGEYLVGASPGDVRAGHRGPGGDLPDRRHDRARRRPAGGRRATSAPCSTRPRRSPS